MGRAAAHGATPVARFDDPTASVLLPERARDHVERYRAGGGGWRARVHRRWLERLSGVMVARTVAIDDAVRAAGAGQLVNLGAGLDGRAWRMPELSDAVVFEVDHPDSQRDKQARAEALTPRASEVRFVPVDFTRDSLETSLSDAGHDAGRPTTWVWEGVVMYLSPAEVEATLQVVGARSAPGSRLIVAYHRPSLRLRFVGMAVRRMGEPFRSTFTPQAMRALLARYGFAVTSDDDLAGIGAGLTPDVARATRSSPHLRIVVADA